MLTAASTALQVWITVVVAVLSATMSESAIDSLQNAIVDNISGSFLKGISLIWIRILVLVLSIPVIIVSLQVHMISSFSGLSLDMIIHVLLTVLLNRSSLLAGSTAPAQLSFFTA
jgi:hypothetical protein